MKPKGQKFAGFDPGRFAVERTNLRADDVMREQQILDAFRHSRTDPDIRYSGLFVTSAVGGRNLTFRPGRSGVAKASQMSYFSRLSAGRLCQRKAARADITSSMPARAQRGRSAWKAPKERQSSERQRRRRCKRGARSSQRGADHLRVESATKRS